MVQSCRAWWRNCAIEADSEIQDIDRMEDNVSPLAANVSRIRELISSLELCHHKAERWIDNIIEAIRTGETNKGLGSRSPDQRHPAEQNWQNAYAAIAAWCAGCPISSLTLSVDALPAAQLLSGIGKRSALKEWQIHRVLEKIRSLIHWPQSSQDPTAQYNWILFDCETTYCHTCPETYIEHEDFWLATVKTIIHDQENGRETELSLGLAIDMLWPCHWNFVENLQIVLNAIGGNLYPEKPYSACGRNITLLPNRNRLEVISNTLKVFYDGFDQNLDVDSQILKQLGEPTAVKKWLAASLDKTIRLQSHPPEMMRALSALSGPDWIKS